MPYVQRLRPVDGGPVSYTVLGADDLPIASVEDFLAHLAARGGSPNTVKGYAHDLSDFFGWLEQGGRDFRSLTLEQLGEFFAWLRRPAAARVPGVFVLPTAGSVLSSSTLIRKRAALAGFYRFHSRRDASVPALLGDPVGPRPTGGFVPMLVHTRRRGVDPDAFSPIRIANPRRVPRTLSDAEAAAVLAACRSARDRFLVVLMHETGLRLGEALGLRHADLRLRGAEVRVVPREDNANGARVKNLKDRVVPASPAVLDAYGDYMEAEYGTLDCDYVFVNLFRGVIGAPMSPDSAKGVMDRLRVRSGVRHFSAHVLRHGFATRLLRAGVPAEVVAELLGHASVNTTLDTYAHLSVEDHRRVLVEAGVLAGRG